MIRSLFNGALPDVVIFDLDGTLVDSVPDLHYSVAATQRHFHLPISSEDGVRRWVGNGALKLVERALMESLKRTGYASAHAQTDAHANDHEKQKTAEQMAALMPQALEFFFETYQRVNGRYSALYDGVLPTLQALASQAVLLALVTNKPIQFTPPLLASLGIERFFSMMLGGDSLPEKKPHPAPLLAVAEHFQVPVERCLMVGDSKSDLQAARAAGMPVVCVSYGYNHGEAIAGYQPDLLVDSLLKLL